MKSSVRPYFYGWAAGMISGNVLAYSFSFVVHPGLWGSAFVGFICGWACTAIAVDYFLKREKWK